MKKVWIIISLAILILLLLFFWRKSCRYGEGFENPELIKNHDFMIPSTSSIITIPPETFDTNPGNGKIGWQHDKDIKLIPVPDTENPSKNIGQIIMFKDNEKIQQKVNIETVGQYTIDIIAVSDLSKNILCVDICNNESKQTIEIQLDEKGIQKSQQVSITNTQNTYLSIYGKSIGYCMVYSVSLKKTVLNDIKSDITTSSDKIINDISNNIQKSSDKIINNIINHINSSRTNEDTKFAEMKQLITQMSNSGNRNNDFATNIYRNF